MQYDRGTVAWPPVGYLRPPRFAHVPEAPRLAYVGERNAERRRSGTKDPCTRPLPRIRHTRNNKPESMKPRLHLIPLADGTLMRSIKLDATSVHGHSVRVAERHKYMNITVV